MHWPCNESLTQPMPGCGARGESKLHDTDGGGEDGRWQALLLSTTAGPLDQAGASVPGDQGAERALQKWRKSCSPMSRAAAARMAATSRLPSWAMKYLRGRRRHAGARARAHKAGCYQPGVRAVEQHVVGVQVEAHSLHPTARPAALRALALGSQSRAPARSHA
jgi:hypothetical protein